MSAIEQILALSDKTISFSLVNDNKAIEEQPTVILPELHCYYSGVYGSVLPSHWDLEVSKRIKHADVRTFLCSPQRPRRKGKVE